MEQVALISCFPAEILEEIFSLCVTWPSTWLYGYQKPKNRFAWTQVCRAWRHIALSSGRLWQRVDLSDSIWAAQFLVRSGQAPLYVTATSPLKSWPSNLALHSNRLHSIDATLIQSDIAQFFLNIGRNLPMLVNLSLKMAPMTSTLFLDLSLPSLRRLSLEGVAIRWEECKRLKYLSLRGHHQAFFPSLPQLHGILKSSPDIEYVRLESFVPSPGETIDLPPIQLSHLTDFVISSYPCVIRSLLSSVHLAAHTHIQLYVTLFKDLSSIFPCHFLRISDPPSSPPQNRLIIRLSRHGVYILQSDSPPWCDDPSKFNLSLSSASPAHVCNSLNYVVNLASIIHLELNVGVLLGISQKQLKSLFRNLHRLESLYTAFNDIEDLLDVLESIDDLTSTITRPNIPYLPNLVKLSFSKPSDVWWHFGGRWTDLILQTAKVRHDHACGLRVLEFCSCHGLEAAMIKELERVVENVVVIEQTGRDDFLF